MMRNFLLEVLTIWLTIKWERDPHLLRWDGFRPTSGEETGPGHELQPVHVCWPNWRLTQPSQAQEGTDMIWSCWNKGILFGSCLAAWLCSSVSSCQTFSGLSSNQRQLAKQSFSPWYFYDWLNSSAATISDLLYVHLIFTNIKLTKKIQGYYFVMEYILIPAWRHWRIDMLLLAQRDEEGL